jgi:hypothetical protein
VKPDQAKESVIDRFVQKGCFYTRENKCEQLFAEGGKCDFTRSAKHGLAEYENIHFCSKAKDSFTSPELGLFYSACVRV